MSFEEWLKTIDDKDAGINLPEGYMQSTFLFGFWEAKTVGRLSIRHGLNEATTKFVGHVGYVVVPEYRRQGVATEMLKQSLPMAKQLGLQKILLTCDEGNIGSQKTIERCGGILENIISVPNVPVRKMRFWIDLER